MNTRRPYSRTDMARSIPFGKPILGQAEKAAVMGVLEGTTLVHGPRLDQFERDFVTFVGGGWAVGVSSCTAALHLSYACFGVGPGDEVIVPAQTHVATAHAVEFVGAKPVFADAEPKTGNLNLDQVEALVTPRTRAISVVHFLGMPVDMDHVNAVARRHHLHVIEDAALGLGGSYKGVSVGLLGDVGCFSFYPIKHITTGEGGMLLTRRADIAEVAMRRRAFGIDREVGARVLPGLYDVSTLGYNYRMNEIQAALGVEQLKSLPRSLDVRKRNYEKIAAGLGELNEIKLLESSYEVYRSSYYCLCVVLQKLISDKRNCIISRLNERGIGTSIYYPYPVPLMSYYRNKYGYSETDFPVARMISENSIALPVGPHVDEEAAEYIIHCMKEVIRGAQFA